MELKQRKKINNIPKFNNGIDLSNSVNGIGGDITGMGAYKQQLTSLPTIKEINGMKTPNTNLGVGGVSSSTVKGAVNGMMGMVQGYNSMQNAVKGTDELMAYSGQRADQAFGVNYQSYNDINEQKAMDDISKSNKTQRWEWLDLELLQELLLDLLYLVLVRLQEEQLELSQDYLEACLEVKKLKKDSVERYLTHNRKLILLIRLINHQLQQKALHSNIIQIMVTRMMMYYTPTEEKI